MKTTIAVSLLLSFGLCIGCGSDDLADDSDIRIEGVTPEEYFSGLYYERKDSGSIRVSEGEVGKEGRLFVARLRVNAAPKTVVLEFAEGVNLDLPPPPGGPFFQTEVSHVMEAAWEITDDTLSIADIGHVAAGVAGPVLVLSSEFLRGDVLTAKGEDAVGEEPLRIQLYTDWVPDFPLIPPAPEPVDD